MQRVAEEGAMAESPGDTRERVLFEGQRVFIIVNAAGALALLVFLNAIWPQAGAVTLKRFVLYGIAAFAAGVGVALLGYIVRYWALSRNKSSGLIHQIAHIWIPVLAVACFVAGMALPVIGGLDTLGGQLERPGQAVPGKKR
jgi:hypothetical protein